MNVSAVVFFFKDFFPRKATLRSLVKNSAKATVILENYNKNTEQRA